MNLLKKFLFLSVSLLTAGKALQADCCGSRGLYVPRSITTDNTYSLALSNFDIYHRYDCPTDRPWVNFYATPFYQESREDCEFGRYFLPNNRSSISVREDGSGDLNSLWFNVIAPTGTSFSSDLSLNPERRLFGAHFYTRFNLQNWVCYNVWFSVAFAAYRLEHCLGLCESNVQNSGTIPGFPNMTRALNNPEWTTGHFANGVQCETGVDDVEFKLGYDHFYCDNYHVGLYLVGTAPTGEGSCSGRVFEPLVGSNHGSFGAGFNADLLAYDFCGHNIVFMTDLKYRYVFSHCENRSFDLRNNGDFSRYLLVANQNSPFVSTPGINVLTTKVDVEPRSTIEFWAALNYAWCSFDVEVGYNLWWRDCENICRPSFCQTDVGVFDLAGQCCSTVPTSASNANITQGARGINVAPSDAAFTPITAGDLSLSSAAQPSALTHKVYGALAYRTEVFCTPVLLGLGGAYEFARDRSCNACWPDHWSVWGKVGLSY